MFLSILKFTGFNYVHLVDMAAQNIKMKMEDVLS